MDRRAVKRRRKKSRKRRKIVLPVLLFVVSLTVIVIWGIRVYQINKKIPQVKVDMMDGTHWNDWKDGVQIKIEGMRFMDDAQIRKNPKVKKGMLFKDEMKLLWIKVKIKNKGTKEVRLDATDLGAESPGWSNIPDMELYSALDTSGKQLKFELKPSEEVEYELPYLLLKTNFRNSEWKKVEKKKYYITMTLYPVKRTIQVPET